MPGAFASSNQSSATLIIAILQFCISVCQSSISTFEADLIPVFNEYLAVKTKLLATNTALTQVKAVAGDQAGMLEECHRYMTEAFAQLATLQVRMEAIQTELARLRGFCATFESRLQALAARSRALVSED